ncbi:winged helix-turn-helix transcriptional regulator [Lentilactobacillus hilgardii]|jgi:DNA-binding HxlR family transcriptional regulator|uniref:MarR family transcriptional regulator n=1 Tax=Lentilactobacillus hilgardii TaxID=1588 RepID=A0A6P1E8V8_LENHI|nr:helix-turn-helix domain-containing protein [Lentilactobacillus hilgardii]EEI72025.1 transcriptional regulator, HxlR family [Lentilactobacillus hilgardii ATCC 27305]MCT3390975.1 transcriptional regulator [Lentilactobacillus hilgardii]QHB51153.1 MarR family transcriptional regulator [Lentilactobacillus hilgardii]RRG12132.1 MAG: transcriptional regulator [Lactobacillus sp.]
MEKIYHIGVEASLDVIGGKWKPIILCHLGNGPLRTGELRRRIPTITQKMLTQQLRELEEDEIIVRKVYNQVPPKVEYYLSDEGKTLRDLLVTMSVWGEKRVKRLQAKGQPVELLSQGHEGYLKF